MSNSFIEQSEMWGKFQEKTPGRGKFWMLNFSNSRGNLDSALLIRQKLPAGKCWLWCPRGPVLEDYSDKTAWHTFMREAQIIAYQEKAIFLRVETSIPKTQQLEWPKGFVTAHDHYLPENTLIIDLSQKEEDILAQMKPKGRYNIRLAAKKGVKIYKSTNIKKDVESFYKILTETTTRDKFTGHSKSYYKNMLETLKKEKAAELFMAEYEGKTIAGIIVTFYEDTATYYFGASSNEYRNLMAPYLLQWEAMREAKLRDMKHYDLLGIAPKDASKSHPWHGITEFKHKFGGKEVQYHEAKEYIFKPLWFKGMKLYKKLRN